MRYCIFAVCLAGAALAQRPPVALARGVLVQIDPDETGTLSIRTSYEEILKYHFDARTYMERDKERVTPRRLRKGEPVEVLSDRDPGNDVRYARLIHVMDEPQPRPAASLGHFRGYRPAGDDLIPRGTMLIAGVTGRIEQGHMVLHVRNEGEKIIRLRSDTRFLEDGDMVDRAQLAPNIRVFVRAGRGLENDIEAYQVIWGEVLNPATIH